LLGSGAGAQVNTGAPQSGIQGPLQFVPGRGFISVQNGFTGPIPGPLQFVPGVGFVPSALSTAPQPGQTGFQFVPGQGFIPQTTGTDSVQFVPGLGLVSGNSTVPVISQSGVNVPQFVGSTGIGGGYYGGYYAPTYYGTGYYGPGYYYDPTWGYGYSGPVPGTGVLYRFGGGPNPPVVLPSAAVPTSAPKGGPATTVTRTPSIDPQELQAAQRMEDIMENRPVTDGTVVSLGATTAKIRYQVDGRTREALLPLENVFFFGPNERTGRTTLQTVAGAAGKVGVGDEVMIPIQSGGEIRSAVAGSRQEMRSSSASAGLVRSERTVKPKAASKKQTRSHRTKNQ